MKRHIQDFNRFSVNETSSLRDEMVTRSHKQAIFPEGEMNTWEFDILIVDGEYRDAGVTPKMTYDFMYALQANNVLLNIVTWTGPGGGTPVIELTGTEEAVKNVFRQSMDEDTAEQFIEDMDEFGPKS